MKDYKIKDNCKCIYFIFLAEPRAKAQLTCAT